MNTNKACLSSKIADLLKEKIINKEFNVGDKLPNENDLSKELNVSRTTLREAIRILVAQNLVEIRRGKGTFIINNNLDFYNLNQLNNSTSDLRDLFEIRLMIEPMAVYYATNRASDEEIVEIINFGKKVEEKILQNKDRSKEEQDFHNAIAKASHNSFIKNLMPIINKSINKGVVLSKEFKKINELTLRDYQMIMDFMKARNGEACKVAMELHILNAMDVFSIQR